MIGKTTNFYKKLEKKMSDLIDKFITINIRIKISAHIVGDI